jgi:hypothetical protein
MVSVTGSFDLAVAPATQRPAISVATTAAAILARSEMRMQLPL